MLWAIKADLIAPREPPSGLLTGSRSGHNGGKTESSFRQKQIVRKLELLFRGLVLLCKAGGLLVAGANEGAVSWGEFRARLSGVW